MWFALAISTGGIATVLNGPFPYPAPWQVTLASVLYVFEIVLFALFSILTIARWILYPHVAVRRALSDADELGSYAIPPIALMTIAALTASQVSTARWGGHAFTLVAYVLWWIGVAWTFVTAVVVFTVFVYTGNQFDRVMTPVIFMAPVGLATAGVEAAFISIFAVDASARLAVPMLVVGYFAIGVAFFMAIILYTMYFHRLLSAGWPAPAQRAALFILVSETSSFNWHQNLHERRLVRRVSYRQPFSSWAKPLPDTCFSRSTNPSPSIRQCTVPSGANKRRPVSTVPAFSSHCYSLASTISVYA
jgi:tellurite resistance protein TehA-like permease